MGLRHPEAVLRGGSRGDIVRAVVPKAFMDRLLSWYPHAFHATDAGNAEAILRHGLLCTTRLLDLFEADSVTRAHALNRPRNTTVPLKHKLYGQATIRDQRPLKVTRLEGVLTDGMKVPEWLELLDSMVFLWATPERLEGFLGTSSYADGNHEVLTISTAELLAHHWPRIRLTGMNTGATEPFAYPRGRETFMSLDSGALAQRLLDRKAKRTRAIAEIAVSDGVADLNEYVIRIERWHGPRRVGVLWQRS